MLDSLQQFVAATHPFWQWSAVSLIGAIPFVESYLGSVLGITAGVSPIVAIVAAIIGNWLSMFLFVTFGYKIWRWRNVKEKPLTKRRKRLKEVYEKYGVAGVSLFGQMILPSQITSMAMVTFGANKVAVIFWQTISIILWGVGMGTFAALSFGGF
ncbi:MAG: small multi-drug export protein [Candidatus Paceibacteria bacterium]